MSTLSLVKDINLGSATSYPSHLININGTLFFVANDGIYGSEIWKSDGTEAGTERVTDINNDGNSAPQNLANVNGTLFFNAYESSIGHELWSSNGTPDGTINIKDIFAGESHSSPRNLISIDGLLFFEATDGSHGYELWSSDGTTDGTKLVADIRSGPYSSGIGYLTNANGFLFFSANDGTHGWELWKSDGTEAGTTLVKDINAGSNWALPRNLTDLNGTLFFTAYEPSSGYELWKSDGTEAGTVRVADMTPGPDRSDPTNLVNVNGTLFFTARDGIHGRELWKSDGTEAGTVRVADINPGFDSSYPRQLTNIDGTLFFVANDGSFGYELWKSDGTENGTVRVADINPGSDWSLPDQLTNVNGTLFFVANDGTSGRELWTSDGTEDGTVQVADVNPGPQDSNPKHFTVIDNKIYFSATNATSGRELWSYEIPSSNDPASLLASALLGSGVTISNATFSGDPQAASTFDALRDVGIGLSAGIVLSTGNVGDIYGPNDSDNKTTNFSLSGDADLNRLVYPRSTQDAAVLEFEFVPADDFLSFSYVFASEEYNEYSGSSFNDVFGFFVTDSSGFTRNIALIPNSSTPVAINNVNHFTNLDYFNNNDISDFGFGATPFDTEFDGFTDIFTAAIQVTPGQPYRFKLAIADTSDGVLDSAVFIGGSSFTSAPLVPYADHYRISADSTLSLDVLKNDLVSPGKTPLIESFDATSLKGGSISIDTNQTPEDPSDDKLSYTPQSEFTGSDSFEYTLSDGDGNTAVGSVNIQVLSTVSLSLEAPSSVLEDGDETLDFTFTRTGASEPLTIEYSVGGSALPGEDWVSDGGEWLGEDSPMIKTVTFEADSDTVTVSIDPIADNYPEGDETVTLALVANNNYLLDDSNSAEGFILNDEIDDGDASFLISGTPEFGETLTASLGADDPDGYGEDGFIYQWQSSTDGGESWMDLIGATSDSYTVAGRDQGRQLRLQVNYTDAEGFDETVWADAGAVPVVDLDPPTLQSTWAGPHQIALTFSEALQVLGGELNANLFEVWVNGQPRTISGAQLDPADPSRVLLDLEGEILDRAASLSVAYSAAAEPDFPEGEVVFAVFNDTLFADWPEDGDTFYVDWPGDSNSGFLADLYENPLASFEPQAISEYRTPISNNDLGLGDAYAQLILTDNDPIDGTGNAAANTITGNPADNAIDGRGGADLMRGGAGNDTYSVDHSGDVTLELENEGLDTVRTSLTWTLADHVENLVLLGSGSIHGTGNALANSISGNGGNNTLDGLAGADQLSGGTGSDTYRVDNPGDVVIELLDQGSDSVFASLSWTLSDHLETLTLTGTDPINGTGNGLNNTITGNSAANQLNGGAGRDRLLGGGGDDTYVVDMITDTPVELAGEGIDTVISSVSWSLANHLENLTLSGSGPLSGLGNSLANTLIGNSGGNILDGGSDGQDWLTGGAGADQFRFSSLPTSFAAADADRISDFSASQADRIRISRTAFGIASTTGVSLSSVTSEPAVNTALSTAALFVYNSSSGELFWNQNGATSGAGSGGGVLAVLENKASLGAGQFTLY